MASEAFLVQLEVNFDRERICNGWIDWVMVRRLPAGGGQLGMGTAGAALTTLVLAVREQSHRFLDRLSRCDVDPLDYFAVILNRGSASAIGRVSVH